MREELSQRAADPSSAEPSQADEGNIRSGFVAIVGRPNVGKSTLVNVLVGQKVSIVSPVPQTTRNRILGVVNRPGAQAILMDTPGVHKPLSRLNQHMMTFVRHALEERDLTVLVADVSERFGKGDEYTLELLKQYAPRTILVLNKIDLIRKPLLLPMIDHYSKLYAFEEIIPISARSGFGLDDLMNAIIKLLPEGPTYFPPETYTDQPERFLASEIIREKLIRHTRQEMPYVTAVLVEDFLETETMTTIDATIIVEKDSQKPIIIGSGGGRLKQIGTEARMELERLFPPKVLLRLYVRVEPHWREDRAVVRELDYREEGGDQP